MHIRDVRRCVFRVGTLLCPVNGPIYGTSALIYTVGREVYGIGRPVWAMRSTV